MRPTSRCVSTTAAAVNEAIGIFREYLPIPSAQPDIDYGEISRPPAPLRTHNVAESTSPPPRPEPCRAVIASPGRPQAAARQVQVHDSFAAGRPPKPVVVVNHVVGRRTDAAVDCAPCRLDARSADRRFGRRDGTQLRAQRTGHEMRWCTVFGRESGAAGAAVGVLLVRGGFRSHCAEVIADV